jgi:acyl-coenzyme A synthetase/AMP-(fatty) acid ligase
VPARQVGEPELIDYVAARVAPHKRIHQIAFVEAIPTSPSGKTLRRLLAADAKQAV